MSSLESRVLGQVEINSRPGMLLKIFQQMPQTGKQIVGWKQYTFTTVRLTGGKLPSRNVRIQQQHATNKLTSKQTYKEATMQACNSE